MAGGNLKVRSGLESREAGVIMCHYRGLRRGGREDGSLINPHFLRGERSPFSSLIKSELKLNG